VDRDFTHFDRGGQVLPAVFVTVAPYDATLNVPVAFTPTYPQDVLGEILARAGMRQLRLAETEKYAHVTFFFNGGRDVVFSGEERVLVKSPPEVATYDLKPEMSAAGVTQECLKALVAGDFSVIIMNFANADMVGHTAKPTAIIRAIETVDACLARIVPAVLAAHGTVLITADHGNAEEMADDEGRPLTAHTTNRVPFILVSEALQGSCLRDGGRLCDIAPTMLKILGLDQPGAMTGVSLL
jgi:2,3-bisphosphoglycerate-independent phosphoglycerate mutase